MKFKIDSIEYPEIHGIRRSMNVLQTPELDTEYDIDMYGFVDGKCAQVYDRGSYWLWEPYGNSTGSYYSPLIPIKIYVRILSNDL